MNCKDCKHCLRTQDYCIIYSRHISRIAECKSYRPKAIQTTIYDFSTEVIDCTYKEK